eukprot:scaffold4203_cov166-Ochromonas_danica.AAC.6
MSNGQQEGICPVGMDDKGVVVWDSSVWKGSCARNGDSSRTTTAAQPNQPMGVSNRENRYTQPNQMSLKRSNPHQKPDSSSYQLTGKRLMGFPFACKEARIRDPGPVCLREKQSEQHQLAVDLRTRPHCVCRGHTHTLTVGHQRSSRHQAH